REDPVLALEGVDRAGLHRLVVPEDRVGADPPLAVVDEGALVVGAEQDELAVELEQVVLGEPFDLAVRDALAVADHPPEIALGRKYLGHDARESTGRASGPRPRSPPARQRLRPL